MITLENIPDTGMKVICCGFKTGETFYLFKNENKQQVILYKDVDQTEYIGHIGIHESDLIWLNNHMKQAIISPCENCKKNHSNCLTCKEAE